MPVRTQPGDPQTPSVPLLEDIAADCFNPNCIHGWIVQRSFSKSEMVKCPNCNKGVIGVKKLEFVKCPSCNGNGGYKRTSFMHNDWVRCSMCNGNCQVTYDAWKDDMMASCERPK